MEGAAVEDRIDLRGRGLRQHAARGTLINSSFQAGMAGLGFLRRFLIAAFLTREEFGIWGILITTLTTLAWLKQVGIGDKYVQQADEDQEKAFQRAFTLQLVLSLAFFAFLCAVLPLYGLAYGHSEILLPGIALAASVPISAFEAPILIAYRRMQFVKQRTLIAVDAVSAFVVTFALGALGAGYWSLVVGALAGSVIGGIAAVATCPYRLRWRFEWETLRSYSSFSLPLLGYQVSNLLVVQGVLLAGAYAVGVDGLGVIALAASISVLAGRVDGIVSSTIYPAVCAVADRVDVLHETFVKSNRLALIWGMPFGVGLALFAGDLVHYVLGPRWEPAIGMLAAFGLIEGLRQIGFNWHIFMRAVNDTKPLFRVALINVGVSFAVILPLMFTLGLTGYAIGMGVAMAVQIAGRAFFLRRLFDGFRMTPYLLRAIAPTAPAAGVILLVRLLAGGERTLALALAELALYGALTLLLTWVFERPLLREMAGYLRGDGGLRARAQALGA